MSYLEPKELIRAKQLVNEGKFDETFQLMKNFEKMGDRSRYDLVSWHLLKCEDHLFGGFFTAINSFINEKFSEGLDRAIFGEHTLLMNSVSPFFMCYVFKGQSYSAQHRIKSFINEIQSNEDVWDTFEKFHKLNKEIQLKDIPSLENLIKDIFIDKTVHLKELVYS